MKKLNRKGFTLVELLAVIIILAIVVGISIPAVLTTINNTRTKAFQAAVSSVADWVDRQYQAYNVSDSSIVTVDSYWTTACVTNGTSENGTLKCTIDADFLNAAGVKSANFNATMSNHTVTINESTGRSCVKLKGNAKGDYQSTKTLSGGICS